MAVIFSGIAATGRFFDTLFKKVGSEEDLSSMVKNLGKNFFDAFDRTTKETGWTRTEAVCWSLGILTVVVVSTIGLALIARALFNCSKGSGGPKKPEELEKARNKLQQLLKDPKIEASQLNSAIARLENAPNYKEQNEATLIAQAKSKACELKKSEEKAAWDVLQNLDVSKQEAGLKAYFVAIGGESETPEIRETAIGGIRKKINRYKQEQKIKEAKTTLEAKLGTTKAESVKGLEMLAEKIEEEAKAFKDAHGTIALEGENEKLYETAQEKVKDLRINAANTSLNTLVNTMQSKENPKAFFNELAALKHKLEKLIESEPGRINEAETVRNAQTILSQYIDGDKAFINEFDLDNSGENPKILLQDCINRLIAYENKTTIDQLELNKAEAEKANNYLNQIILSDAAKNIDTACTDIDNKEAMEKAKNAYVKALKNINPEISEEEINEDKKVRQANASLQAPTPEKTKASVTTLSDADTSGSESEDGSETEA